MKKTQKQSGFAHLMVITVILAVAVVGLLGFVFWQNFVQVKSSNSKKIDNSKVTDKADSENNDPSQIALTEIAFDQNGGSGLALKYPKTWKLEHSVQDENVGIGDTNIITSPDQNISVNFYAAMMGVGGTCDPADKSTTIVQITRDAVPNYPGHSFYTYITHNTFQNDSYYLSAEVIEDSQSKKSVKAGDSPCLLGLGLFNDANGKPTSVRVRVKSLERLDDTLKEVQSIIDTTDFAIAKRIVLSLYVK